MCRHPRAQICGKLASIMFTPGGCPASSFIFFPDIWDDIVRWARGTTPFIWAGNCDRIAKFHILDRSSVRELCSLPPHLLCLCLAHSAHDCCEVFVREPELALGGWCIVTDSTKVPSFRKL